MNAQLDAEFRDFMHGRWQAMVRLAYALTGDQGHAEDVAQTAFARAYASWPKVRRTENPEAYVRRIVVNENRNRFRKQRVTERLTDAPPEPAPGPGVADATSRYDERSALMAALRRLGPRQRSVVVLRSWLGLTEAEAAAGLIASGTVNGKRWQLVAHKPGTEGAGHGQQEVMASGPAFGPTGLSASGPAFTAAHADPVTFAGFSAGPSQAAYGAVAADVSYVMVRLGNGTVLTLHPVRLYGVRLVAFAVPVGAPIASATAYSPRGEIATAIPFNDPGGMATFGTWLRPGQSGLARASGLVGSGSYLGKAWSVRAYLGPWGVCLAGQAAGTSASSCAETTTGSELGTSVMFWTEAVPAVAAGSAAPSVVRVAVTSPDGKTTQVRPVTVGGLKLFAFPFGQGPRPWRWTAYDGAGHVVASDQVIQAS